MAQLTLAKLNAAAIRLSEFKSQAQAYFDTTQAQVFRGLVYTGNQAAIKQRADLAIEKYTQSLTTLDSIIYGHVYQGRVPTLSDVEQAAGVTMSALTDYHNAVEEWNQANPGQILMADLAVGYQRSRDTLNSMLDGLSGAVKTVSKWVPWIPWIVVGALVLPSVLRLIAKKRREGTDAALEAGAAEIEMGRARVGRAAGQAASVAVKAAVL